MNDVLRGKAKTLRRRGLSLNEISERLKIAKSTAWHWGLSAIDLSRIAKHRLVRRKYLAYRKSLMTRRRRHTLSLLQASKRAEKDIQQIKVSDIQARVICSLLYWCEGSKERNAIRFANSDPTLVATFMHLFRQGFKPDEKKLRAVLHLHGYHGVKKQKIYWSKITRIPVSQFAKSYRKSPTGRRKRPGYQGCISVRYYDTILASEIRELYTKFATNLGA